MSRLAAALMTASALVALPAIAFADETTIIHEQKVVVSPPPPVASAETQTQTHQTTSIHRVAVHHAAKGHRVAMVRHVALHTRTTHALSAVSAAVQTSAAVRTDETQSQATQAPQVVEDRRTVIRRDDEGDVERHTRIIRQGPDGMTSIEHHSAEGVSAGAPDAP